MGETGTDGREGGGERREREEGSNILDVRYLHYCYILFSVFVLLLLLHRLPLLIIWGGGILSKNELLWNIHVYMAIVLLFPQYDMYIIQLTLSPFSFLFILFAV